jgi:hypothetical protein
MMVTKNPPEAKGKGVGTAKAPGPSETKASVDVTQSNTKSLTSYDIFELCVQRARNLLKLHQAVHGKAGKPETYTADANRAAIVLAISALDAFVSDFMISQTRTLLVSKASKLPDALSTHILKFLKADELLEAARKDDLLERVEKAFRSDFDKRSFQGTKNIEEQLRVVGYEAVFHQLAIKAKVNEDTLRENLNRYTTRRHAIAHRGDYDLSQNPPKENVVTKKEAEECIKLVCLIARHMQEMGTTL